MNFNKSRKPEYKLNANLISEMINLYGVQVKFLKVEKINQDDIVFGDRSHIKTNNDDIFDLTVLPATSENWDNIGVNFSQFGMTSTETADVFVSRKSIESIYPDLEKENGFSGILGNLIIMPNDTIMEITNFDFETESGSNVYTNSATKNAYRITLVKYNVKMNDEFVPESLASNETEDITGSYETLDSYFDEIQNGIEEQDAEAELIVDTKTDKVIMPVVDDVFGRF